MINETEPKLDAPGAGLPSAEQFLFRILLCLLRWTGNRNIFNAFFQKERRKISKLLQDCDEEKGSYRVLIRRPAGLEDSSRYWSVWMTLDHLRIVNNLIARGIQALGQGTLPEEKASIAAVKPNEDVNASVVTKYDESCDTLLSVVTELSNLNTPTKSPHPWFGPLNAAGWFTLAGQHLRIHRVQIERILAGLSSIQK